MDSFFIKVKDKEFGPVDKSELRDLIKQGSFSEEDLVWNENLDEWYAAASIPELTSFFNNGHKRNFQKKIVAFASGKGGVGKTVLSASIGVGLASMGHEVILVDGDLGGPNLHTCLGILDPPYTFFDFYSLEKDSLSEIVLETPVDNLQLISGACGTLGLANPKYFQKQRFIRELKTLQADYLLLDLGAGASYNVIDFFLLADEKFLVITPEPTSLHEAFGFVKICLMREITRRLKKHPKALEVIANEQINRPGKIQRKVSELLQQIRKCDEQAFTIFMQFLETFQPKLILNSVKEKADTKEALALQVAMLELLSVNSLYLGHIAYDDKVGLSVKKLKPFLLNAPGSKAAQDLHSIIREHILGKTGIKEIIEKRRWRKQVNHYSEDYPENDLIQESVICSVNCFYWDDCEYADGGNVCKVRHLEPVYIDR
ncbi:MAG: P-loop NTPase [bacterium]